LVAKFFDLHDPTQVNRQGPDIGDQYRSGIFFNSPEQEKSARDFVKQAEAAKRFKKPIATIIEPEKSFWRAEEYHQQYFAKRGRGSCHI
jgi:peptide-methionine (S)-S-oxide reductase